MKLDFAIVPKLLQKKKKALGMRKAVGFSPTSTTLGRFLLSCGPLFECALCASWVRKKCSFCIRVRLLIKCGFYARYANESLLTLLLCISQGVERERYFDALREFVFWAECAFVIVSKTPKHTSSPKMKLICTYTCLFLSMALLMIISVRQVSRKFFTRISKLKRNVVIMKSF